MLPGIEFVGTVSSGLIDLNTIFEKAVQEPTHDETISSTTTIPPSSTTEPRIKPAPLYYTQPAPTVKMYYQPGPQYKRENPNKKVVTSQTSSTPTA
ncbi:MAG: hypothetical protein H6765_08305 [Candidatus Peribacteria bacterium]|nr:MAG: hypothetical protein H6765_08305 [Candidatus Peribacteria bacterium]